MPANFANEGIALEPTDVCEDGVRQAWFSDDADTDGHALRGIGLIDENCDAAPAVPGDDEDDDEEEPAPSGNNRPDWAGPEGKGPEWKGPEGKGNQGKGQGLANGNGPDSNSGSAPGSNSGKAPEWAGQKGKGANGN